MAGLMKALSNMYEKPSASNKVHLMRRLFNLWMMEGASVAQHLNELNSVTTQLSSVEIEFDDEVRALILLSSLPDSWNATITTVISSSGTNKLKFGDVRDLVLSEEIRRRESGESSTTSVLHMESKGRNSTRKNDLARSNYRDSRASFHATSKKEFFESYVSGNLGKVYLGDDQPCDIVGKGIVKIKLNGSVWELKNVRHIPVLRKNLISIGQLASEGYTTNFQGDNWKISKGAMTIAHGKKSSTLYMTSGSCCSSAVAMGNENSNMWHQRLAERMNRTLTEKARSIRIQSGLPKQFWADVHISDQGRNKLDPKSKKCTFIGYGGDEFGYRIWDDENKKAIRTRDVIFDERIMYKDRHKTDASDSAQSGPMFVDYVPDTTMTKSIIRNHQQEDSVGQTSSPQSNMIQPSSPTPILRSDASKWDLAMKDEMQSLISNQTWKLIELPKGKNALHNKWVYQVKKEHDGSKRTVLSIVVIEDLHLEQLDVETNFLHENLDEEIYMHQPEGFSKIEKDNMVCKLKKSLYGLKQASRQWYKKFDNFMHKEDFQKCNADHCCYIKRYQASYIILLLYVYDMLVAGSNMDDIRNLKHQLSKDLGPAKKILGMQIIRDKHKGTLQLSQSEYIKSVLQTFNMSSKPVSTPLASHFRLSEDQSPQAEEDKVWLRFLMLHPLEV
ncbi:hypothetical protein LIER_11897 [Lithospermum erythrorhizon]|uniref:Reverse transcriptase Ty1/copia-type domain-containing protein n=1 Tax=Lithospermum erythrorhizon TaxID=34254 RepID=A0AAV3PPR9_LITER